MFNLPTVLVWTVGVLLIVHVIRALLPYQSDVEVLMMFGFVPARYTGAASFLPGGLAACFWTPLTYGLLHADWLHLGVNVLWMLSFGSAVARRFGTSRFLLLLLVAIAAGALAQFLAMPGNETLVIGASAGVSGITAAAARFAFAPGGPLAGGGARPEAYLVPDPGLRASLLNPYSAFFILMWFGINLLFGVGGQMLPGVGGAIAWQAHIGGFLAGLLLFPLFDPVGRQTRS
ncbi:rhomboid family intramembrane serine protease [Afifella sp. H1R]|uniref:rhomboid family intramembrane serine protease n=1 Tax=Afifella sp. H1R TaxID=2908841 RepID=UPI001F26C1D5|nr:rhomboid family intramembrane serine protease [Afifella sp. H1R]MCF1503232.1 rhomboid family intramembrane serine protease [Afifella sp. H1R]